MTIVAQKHVGEYEFVVTRTDGTVETYQQKNKLNYDVIKEIYKNPNTLDGGMSGLALCLSTKVLAETSDGFPDPLTGTGTLQFVDENYGKTDALNLAMYGIDFISDPGVFLTRPTSGNGSLTIGETIYNRGSENRIIRSAMVIVAAGAASGIDLDTPITLKPNDSITVRYNLITPFLDFNFSKQFEVNGVQVTGTVKSLKQIIASYNYWNAFAYMQDAYDARFYHPEDGSKESQNGLIASQLNSDDGVHYAITDSLERINCTQGSHDGVTIKTIVSFTLRRDTDIKRLVFTIGNTLAEMDFGKNVRFLEDQVVKFEFETVINYN